LRNAAQTLLLPVNEDDDDIYSSESEEEPDDVFEWKTFKWPQIMPKVKIDISGTPKMQGLKAMFKKMKKSEEEKKREPIQIIEQEYTVGQKIKVVKDVYMLTMVANIQRDVSPLEFQHALKMCLACFFS
jgi:hypothetical protein